MIQLSRGEQGKFLVTLVLEQGLDVLLQWKVGLVRHRAQLQVGQRLEDWKTRLGRVVGPLDLGIRRERSERQRSWEDGIPKLLVARANLLTVMDQLKKNKLVVVGIHRLLLHEKLRTSHCLATVLVIEIGVLHEELRNCHLGAVLVTEQGPRIGLSPAVSRAKPEKAVANRLDKALDRVLANTKLHQ